MTDRKAVIKNADMSEYMQTDTAEWASGPLRSTTSKFQDGLDQLPTGMIVAINYEKFGIPLKERKHRLTFDVLGMCHSKAEM